MEYHKIILVLSLAVSVIGTVKNDVTSKRGAAYNDVATVAPLSKTGMISWAYNWAISEPGMLPASVEYVPMLRAPENLHAEEWQESLTQALSAGSKYILGFNEPDRSDQADLTPLNAANLYKEHIASFQNKAKLISPAVSSSTATGQGLEWLEEFMEHCSSCGISGIAVHWYGNSAVEFKSFVTEAINQAASYGISEVWVTEFSLFAAVNGVTDQKTSIEFIQDVTRWLDSQTAVSRYSYFMCAEGYLVSSNSLNGAGQAYTSPSQSDSSANSATSSNLCDETG